MTIFQGGSAHGQTLLLRRSPEFLRVVFDGKKWDALDCPGDQPKTTEKIFVYRLVGERGSVHIRGCRGGPSGFFRQATYITHPNAPEESVLRSQRLWDKWCRENVVCNDPSN